MLTAGLVFASFIGFLNSSQQVLAEQYELGTQFPLYFAVLALALGASTLTNSGWCCVSRWQDCVALRSLSC